MQARARAAEVVTGLGKLSLSAAQVIPAVGEAGLGGAQAVKREVQPPLGVQGQLPCGLGAPRRLPRLRLCLVRPGQGRVGAGLGDTHSPRVSGVAHPGLVLVLQAVVLLQKFRPAQQGSLDRPVIGHQRAESEDRNQAAGKNRVEHGGMTGPQSPGGQALFADIGAEPITDIRDDPAGNQQD